MTHPNSSPIVEEQVSTEGGTLIGRGSSGGQRRELFRAVPGVVPSRMQSASGRVRCISTAVEMQRRLVGSMRGTFVAHRPPGGCLRCSLRVSR
jgi:hypothetical protein